MRFLKVSVVILALLSFLGAGASLFLSTVRENEKEKRLHLEQVRSQLEEQVRTLESEKSELERKVTDIESQNQDLSQKLEAEKAARSQATDLANQKDIQVKTLQDELSASGKTFEDAQNRNRELEKILDQLEMRIQTMEGQAAAQAQAASQVGYVELETNPAASVSESPPQAEKPTITLVPKEEKLNKVVSVSAVSEREGTKGAEPHKGHKFFSFFGHHEKAKPKSESSDLTSKEKTSLISQPKVGISQVTKPEGSVEPTSVSLKTAGAQVPQYPLGRETRGAAAIKAIASDQTGKKTGQGAAIGRVLLINRKFNFIVTNLGTRNGLALNDVLGIQKKGVEIAKVRIEKIYDEYCAAYIIEEQSEAAIEEGDAVAPK